MRARPSLVRAFLICLLAIPGPVVAQSVSVRAFLSPGSTVGVGGPFVLNVEISGVQAFEQEPVLPDLSAFAQYLDGSTQSSMQVVNGQTTVSLTIQYRYQALTEGSFQIPSFTVVAGGQAHATEALDLTVAIGSPGASAGNGSGIGPDELFVTAEASKASVREGEPFVVEYRIWTRVDVTNFGMTSVPEPEGFWVEDISPRGPPEVEQLTRNNVQYASAVIRRVALVSTGSGTRTIEPIGVEAQVRVQGRRDIFGRSSLFGNRSVPTTVLSNPLTVEVQPLPPGRPATFSGVVGTLRVTSELDRDSVDANEAVTLTVRVAGDGNIHAVQPPELDFPADFEVFPPEVSEAVSATTSGLSGSKTFEYVLIPRAPGNREIPPVAVSFFDGASAAYRTTVAAAIPLTVSGTVVEGPAALARGGIAQLREDIRFIHLGSLDLRTTGRPLLGGGAFWLFALLPLVGIVGALALRRHQDLLEGDVAYARGRRAGRVAKKRLAEARRLATRDDPRAFYAEVARALRGLVADRLNLAEAGLQTTELEGALVRAGVEAGTRDDLSSVLGHCDRQRFAPPGSDAEEKARFLERAGVLMTALHRAVR